MEEKKLFTATTLMSPDIYTEFYKFYYRDRYKKLGVTALVIAIIMLIGIIAASRLHLPQIVIAILAICVWVSVFFALYPYIGHRRPLKREKNKKQTTHFTFYESHVSEKTNGEKSSYEYSKLLKVIERPKMIYIYHTLESVSIVNKYNVRDSSDELCALLRSKVSNYKKSNK